MVVFALLWHWFTLLGTLGFLAVTWWGWGHRRRLVRGIRRALSTRLVAYVAGGAAIVVHGASRADNGGYSSTWGERGWSFDEEPAAVDGPVTWHAGIRFGPYTPDIDKQFGRATGPYEQMYGGYEILPIIDVDRILWTGFGQVGAGGSIGYMQKSAHSFEHGSDPEDPHRPRSPGSTNTFRLVPLALTASFRFTWLDDQYGIPLVPYIRGGLSYYAWWVSADADTVCKDGGTAPGCSKNEPAGASLGVQGSIGVAIRAERINDAFDMASMRQSGIRHAGFYGELSLAKVDGFGSDTKLSVGGRTWFAGVDFEF